ncbi:hypothetical protein VTJ49DRAFT_2717 [Mycothermus thermophilus]|uniref:Uncharacterized protein n=1 Tax=Humicola insolens TaxID=85995 RepID=A0ABR3VAB2_HUMIN
MAEKNGNQSVPEQLFHTTLTVVNYHDETYGFTQDVYVLGTHTSLPAAKAFALTALESLGYTQDDFETYTARKDTPGEEWPHGENVVAYAKTPRGQDFLVGIDSKPNTQALRARPDDTVELPEGHAHLHYVLHNKTDYDQAKGGEYQTTDIRGCYAHRSNAVKAAKSALRKDRAEYAQYDERGDTESESEWPFGEDVVARAVAQTGENLTVAVRSVPGAYKKHRKSQEGC